MQSWQTMEAANKASNGKRRKSSWTSEKETRLIGLYQNYRLLWDHRHPDYYKRDQRERAMRAIADGMGNEFDVVNVKDKIKTLRDYFVKEMKKEEGSRTSSCSYISRWEHFKCWEFLRGTISVDTSSQPAGAADMSYPEVKREAPDVYPASPSYSGENYMILPSTPDSASDEECLGSPRKRSMRLHHPTSNGSPLKHFALGSEITGPSLTKEPVPSFMNGFRAASQCPLPTNRLHLLTVPECTPPRQNNHVNFSGGSGGQLYETPTSPLSVTGACTGACTSASTSVETVNHAGPSTSGINVAHLDGNDCEALFCQQIASELREMAKYQRDLAKVRIQQVLFDVKYMSQAHVVGTSEDLPPIQPTNVAVVSQLGQKAASIPTAVSAPYSREDTLFS